MLAELEIVLIEPTIAIDFDGTICDAAYPSIGRVKPGAKEAIAQFRRQGYQVMIYSCRTCHWYYNVFGGDPGMHTLDRPTVQQMITWLGDNGIEYDLVDDGSKGKPLANYYIDDRAIHFQDNWPEIAKFIGSQECKS